MAASGARRRFVELRDTRGVGCATGGSTMAKQGELSVGRRGLLGERPRAARLALATEETEDRERARATQAEHDAQPEVDVTGEGGGGAAIGVGERTADPGIEVVDTVDEAGRDVSASSGRLSQISSYRLLSSAAETGSYCARTACTSSFSGTGGGVSGNEGGSSCSSCEAAYESTDTGDAQRSSGSG